MAERAGHIVSHLSKFYWSFVLLAVLPSSANSSEKVKHLLNNKKAGISFGRKAEIITDKDRLRQVWKDFLIHCYPGGPVSSGSQLRRSNYGIDGKHSTISF